MCFSYLTTNTSQCFQGYRGPEGDLYLTRLGDLWHIAMSHKRWVSISNSYKKTGKSHKTPTLLSSKIKAKSKLEHV